MKYPVFISLIFVLTIFTSAKAQSIDSLNQLKNYDFPVYYSSGHQQTAETIASRIGKAILYHKELLGFKPVVTLVILSAKDWETYTAEPVIYGMPHYNQLNKRLIVAAEDNAYWKGFLPPLNQLPEGMRKPIQTTYSNSAGQLTVQAFFDLLAIHELGHAFHMQAGLTMQRNWMNELFANILLHTYIAEKEPELLPALTLFPKMVIGGGTKEYKYTSLQDIQDHYGEIARQYPKNYGWYQCRWHSAAADIYDAGGKQALQKLWDALKNKKEILTDEELVAFLKTTTNKRIADMIENWDRDMSK